MSDIDFYLTTTFQNSIESALYYNDLPAPEQTPYVHKYKAIEILKALKPTTYSFISEIFLGDIYSDVEQNSDALRSYQKALEIFQSSSEQNEFKIDRYYNRLLQIYNLLGLSYVNIDKNEEGIGMLAKAMNIYEGVKDVYKQTQYSNIYHNRTKPLQNCTFAYYYEGGINKKQTEASHTLTLFYLAQAYAKLGFKDKAALYCGNTLKRQYAVKSYELKDFCLNLMSLADYYRNNYFYSQAEYLLMVGLKVLPQQGKKRLRSSFYMALGDNLKELLDYSCISFVNGQNQQPETDNVIARKFLQFEGSEVAWPKVTLGRNSDQCKSIFRKANTQYKKALETFVLDGYVTEHIEILFSQSKLYKSLCIIDQSAQRRISMLERRKQLMQPILKQLNPKAYMNTWQKILVQLSQIMNQVFEMRCTLYFGVKGQFPSNSKLNLMNQSGLKAIEYYSMIEKTLLQLKDVDKNQAYYQSIVNAKFNISKIYSKLMKSDTKQRVEFLKKSMGYYKDLLNFITTVRTTTAFKNSFKKEENLTFQMVQMLPNKIDRVNSGQNDL